MKKNEVLQSDLKKNELDLDSFDFDSMELLLDEDIDELLNDVSKLTTEKELINDPNQLANEIYISIFNQLGVQNELDLSGELLINQYKNEHKGETKKSALVDAVTSTDYQKIRKKNTEASKTKKGIKDTYTGKIIRTSDGHQVNTDHVVSRSKIYGEGISKNFRELSGNSVSDLANLDSNLVATTEAANKSKKDKSVKQYLKGQEQRKKDLKNNLDKDINKINNDGSLTREQKKVKIEKKKINYNDKIDIDPTKMTEADKKAQKAIYKKELTDSAKGVGKEAGNAALRTVIMQTTAKLIKSIIDNLIDFFKAKKKSFNVFKEKIKNAFNTFFKSISQIFKSSFSSATSSAMNNLLSIFLGPIKKIWSGIKTLFSTVRDAIKTFLSPESKDEDISIRLAKVGKVITAGIVTVAVVTFSETITQALEIAFPVLKGIRIPVLGSLTGFIVELILALLGGLFTGFVINMLNKFIASKKKAKLDEKIIQKQNKILKKQYIKKNIAKVQVGLTKNRIIETINNRHHEANIVTTEYLEKIHMESDDERLLMEKMKKMNEDLDILL